VPPADLPEPAVLPEQVALDEGRRILTICNACRYCEGYCAVFPALEALHGSPRGPLHRGDLHYLANLCHNCAECYYACQYAPPHEFSVNVPQVLAQIRLDSYRSYARPRVLGRLFRRSGSLALAVLAVSLVVGLVGLTHAPSHAASFYDVIPHGLMVAMFGAVSLLIVIALAASLAGPLSGMSKANLPALARAARSMLALEYLSSGGAGCTYPDAQHSQFRRWFHHFTFYGFLLCFASTSVAAWYHYALARRAPYSYQSLPVILGMLGGIGLLIGPPGLYRLKRRRDPAIADSRQDGLDLTFLALLFAAGFTGLLLLVLRQSPLMPALLVIHLVTILALFATLPYGKFVHGFYRAAALLRYTQESEGPVRATEERR
jgi:citrate/tricarballylate utilization protein